MLCELSGERNEWATMQKYRCNNKLAYMLSLLDRLLEISKDIFMFGEEYKGGLCLFLSLVLGLCSSALLFFEFISQNCLICVRGEKLWYSLSLNALYQWIELVFNYKKSGNVGIA
jgi:hypothetical protein